MDGVDLLDAVAFGVHVLIELSQVRHLHEDGLLTLTPHAEIRANRSGDGLSPSRS